MPFAIIEEKSKNFKKTEYLSLTAGNHLIRILEPAVAIKTHYVLNKYTITCLGEDCPICSNNKKIINENPENFRDVKGFYPTQRRYLCNVLDKTVVKVCPSCQTENRKTGNSFPAMCSSCGAVITSVEPHPCNKVKVLSLGVTVAGQLNILEKAVVNAQQDPVGIQNFDIILSVDGAGRQKKIAPIPVADGREPVDVPTDAFHDVSKAVIKLTAEEIIDLLKGVSIKDIFLSRRTESTENTSTAESVEEETEEDIRRKIEEMMGG